MEHENFQHLESVLTEDDKFSPPGLTNNRLNNGRKGNEGRFQSYNVGGKREGQAKGLIKPERVHQRVLVLTQKEAKILYATSSLPTSRSSPSPTPHSLTHSPPNPWGLAGKFSPGSVRLRFWLGNHLQNRTDGISTALHRRENNLRFDPMILLLPPPLATEDNSLNIHLQVWYTFLFQTSTQNYKFTN